MTTMTDDVDLDATIELMAKEWLLHKSAEQSAQAARRAVEDELIKLIDRRDEGTSKRKAGRAEIAAQFGVTYSVDADALARIADQVPPEIQKRVIRWKPAVDARELKYLRNNEPQIYAVLAQAIEAKPGRPTFTVKFED